MSSCALQWSRRLKTRWWRWQIPSKNKTAPLKSQSDILLLICVPFLYIGLVYKYIRRPTYVNDSHTYDGQYRPQHATMATKNKKAELSQRWARDAPHIWVPPKISRVPDYAHGYIFRNFDGLFPVDVKNVRTKFEVRSYTCSWNNRGHPKNWAVPAYAHAAFSPKFLMAFCSEIPCECSGQIWSP